MLKPIEQIEDRIATQEEAKPEFRSSFKAWIRVVAFIIVAVFLPEQVAQAVEYDWRVLWGKPAMGMPLSSGFVPSGIKDLQTQGIPQVVRSILKDIANKPVTSIKISDNLTIELDKPLEMSNQRVEEIFNWLQGRPCGSKALFDYLRFRSLNVAEQDVAVMALTTDILNGVVKPEGDPKVIKNSLYALSRAGEYFGSKLVPIKFELDLAKLEENAGLAPFIAHLKGDHYVLVTKITAENVYFSDEHKEEFISLAKFQERFSGYALVSD